MTIHYVTYADLVRDVEALDAKLPREIAGVIGIPRSGMLPATMLALRRNVGLGSLDGVVVTGDMFVGGSRKPHGGRGAYVVVDDSVYHGRALSEAKRLIENSCHAHWLRRAEVIYAAVYGHPDTPDGKHADVIAREIPSQRYFAWNLLHHPDAGQFMLDMDGVLCVDPPMIDDTGAGDEYGRWLPKAQPLNLPSVEVGAICTNRLSVHAAATSNWLSRHGVPYRHLHMRTESTAEHRRAGEPPASYKARTYLTSDCTLFIESCMIQAEAIATLSGKPVLHLASGRVF